MARRERGKHIPSPEECAYNVFLRVISIFGGSKMMNLLDKFETVTIPYRSQAVDLPSK